MKQHTQSFAAICVALAFPLSAFAQGFDYNTVGQVQSDQFRADQSAAVLIGQRAVAQEDVDVGDVVDVIHDEDMMVRGYIVDVGGFLGIDATPVFFPASRASVRIDGIAAELVLDMNAPEVREIARAD